MSSERILTWVNGEIHDPADAKISIFDRGFLFGDSVYELTRFFDGEGVGFDLHVERLERSMSEAGITGFNASDYRSISSDLMQALEIRDACIYIQVTRGVQMPAPSSPGTQPPPHRHRHRDPECIVVGMHRTTEDPGRDHARPKARPMRHQGDEPARQRDDVDAGVRAGCRGTDSPPGRACSRKAPPRTSSSCRTVAC